MFFDIVEARYLDGNKLTLRFEDGSQGEVDIARHIKEGTVFWALRDDRFFRSFRIEYGALVWGDGQVDIAPETLYVEATGKSIAYPAPQRTGS